MHARIAAACLLVAATSVASAAISRPQASSLAGTVRLADGTPAAGALVTARLDGATFAHTVIAATDGAYRFGPVPDGAWRVSAGWGADAGPESMVQVRSGDVRVELEAPARAAGPAGLPASSLLALLPDGEEKRRFIRDCTNCHTLNAQIAYPEGRPRTAAEWAEATARMLAMAGPTSGFPVIGAGREPQATAAFVTPHLTDGARLAEPPRADARAAGAVITEYTIPAPTDLPHDLAVLGDGRVLITGMFTHRMYVLDPESGAFETEAIPVANANPRAVELGEDGSWWVVLGGPNAIARRSPAGEWTHWPVGTYAHSLAFGQDGRVWFNGHFSRNPEILGFVDPAANQVTSLDVPAHPNANVGGGPIPYELRVAPDGRIWGSELIGDRVFVHDPGTGDFRFWTMPLAHSAPRRLDIGPDGIVWIPEYAAGRLARLDPASGELTHLALPVADASPYIARVDHRSGRVWLGTGSADAIFAYDPGTQEWTTYPLPSRATLVRHLDIDPRNGDLWIAYGASPGPPSKVARLRVSGR